VMAGEMASAASEHDGVFMRVECLDVDVRNCLDPLCFRVS